MPWNDTPNPVQSPINRGNGNYDLGLAGTPLAGDGGEERRNDVTW
jgi:hypothetical protein